MKMTLVQHYCGGDSEHVTFLQNVDHWYVSLHS